jgi:hypothetical protein
MSLRTETIPPELIVENYERRAQHVLFDRLDYLLEFFPGFNYYCFYMNYNHHDNNKVKVIKVLL